MKTLLILFSSMAMLGGLASGSEEGLFIRIVHEEASDETIAMTDDRGDTLFVSTAAILVPGDVESASVVSSEGGPMIVFDFRPSAHGKMAEATRSAIGKRLAIVIDGELISAPVVQEPFHEGCNISGNFTQAWAEEVVSRINGGAAD